MVYFAVSVKVQAEKNKRICNKQGSFKLISKIVKKISLEKKKVCFWLFILFLKEYIVKVYKKTISFSFFFLAVLSVFFTYI